MKKIYFVRHGECQLNKEKRFAGTTESGLTESGRQQCVQAAQDILDKKIQIDKIISSSMGRARESAEIIAKSIGYPLDEVEHSGLFNERDFGILNGTPRKEFFDAYSYQDIDNVPEAESLNMLIERARTALKHLNSIPENAILVVGHSGFYRAFVRVLHGEKMIHEYSSPFVSIENGKVYDLS